jgi:hypothetical protein
MTTHVPSSHTNTYVFLQFYFWKTLHVSADVSHHQVYATTSRNTGDKSQYTVEFK